MNSVPWAALLTEKLSSIVLSVNIRSKENKPSSSFSIIKAGDTYYSIAVVLKILKENFIIEFHLMEWPKDSLSPYKDYICRLGVSL